jgi:hypothetical protein
MRRQMQYNRGKKVGEQSCTVEDGAGPYLKAIEVVEKIADVP